MLAWVGLAPVAEVQAAVPVPAAEDMALVEPILEGKIDVEPEQIIHVAPLPGPDGDGSEGAPRRDLITVVAEATAGQAIHLAPGDYDMPAIADAFGHVDSALWTGASGEPGRPIVLRTDPAQYDAARGQIAALDFGYDNAPPGWRGSAFIVRDDFWVFERFEMRRMQDRGFWVDPGAHDDTFRELDLHHANFDGTNNEGLILMAASAGPIDNVVIGCHLHHAGNIDVATDEVLDFGGVNGGCFYSETRLSYDSVEPATGHDATRAEWEAGIEPPDGDVYLVGNEVSDCHYGLGLKNMSRGPYYFVSNYIHDVEFGVFSPFSLNTVRNNIIHDAGVGIEIGRAQTDGPMATFLKMTGNGFGSEVAHNTIVGAAMGFRGGWNSTVHHNLVVDTDEPVQVRRNQYYWWEDGEWPGVRGEFLIGDLDASHPFYDLVPGYLQETPGEFVRMQLTDNCYTAEPEIGPVDFVQPVADITGMTFDADYRVLSEAERSALFVDEAAGDLRRVEGGPDCGSNIGLLPEPGGDDSGGNPTTGGDDSGDGSGGTGGNDSAGGEDDGMSAASGADTGTSDPSSQSESEGGCGCRSGAPRHGSAWWLALGWLAVARRRRRSAWRSEPTR
jgi:MYXO-CTERM domain-containing protein